MSNQQKEETESSAFSFAPTIKWTKNNNMTDCNANVDNINSKNINRTYSDNVNNAQEVKTELEAQEDINEESEEGIEGIEVEDAPTKTEMLLFDKMMKLVFDNRNGKDHFDNVDEERLNEEYHRMLSMVEEIGDALEFNYDKRMNQLSAAVDKMHTDNINNTNNVVDYSEYSPNNNNMNNNSNNYNNNYRNNTNNSVYFCNDNVDCYIDVIDENNIFDKSYTLNNNRNMDIMIDTNGECRVVMRGKVWFVWKYADIHNFSINDNCIRWVLHGDVHEYKFDVLNSNGDVIPNYCIFSTLKSINVDMQYVR